MQADEYIALTPSPSATSVPSTPTAAPARTMPTPEAPASPAIPGDLLLPGLGLLGLLLLSLAGLVILWLWRRGHDGPEGAIDKP